jgi:hypothetical protein
MSIWNDDTIWTVSDSEVADNSDSIGPYYQPEDIACYIVGESEVGHGVIGSTLINGWVPRHFYITLSRVPTELELMTVRWLADLLKSAEEHYDITWPQATQFWVVSQSQLGFDTVLAPDGWVIGESTIGISAIVNGSVTIPDAAI